MIHTLKAAFSVPGREKVRVGGGERDLNGI